MTHESTIILAKDMRNKKKKYKHIQIVRIKVYVKFFLSCYQTAALTFRSVSCEEKSAKLKLESEEGSLFPAVNIIHILQIKNPP